MIAGVALAQEDTSQTAAQEDTSLPAAQEDTSLPAPEPVVPAPGRVRCLVSENGQAVRGELSDASGQRADCAQGLELPPGLHRVEVHLAGSVDNATEVRWVRVASGVVLQLSVGFETGELILLSQSEGTPMAAEADLWSDGAVRARLTSGVPARIRIGSYVLDARTTKQSERFEAVHVSPRGRTALVWQVKQ